MRGAAGTALVTMAIACAAHPLGAQMLTSGLDVFSTISGIAGATPLLIDNVRHLGAHGGFRGDAGIQGERFGLALGARVWEFAPTQSFGGHGVDGFLTCEWRVSFDTRSIVRVAVGGGFDDIDGGRGPERPGVGTSGAVYSFGVAREVYAPSGARVILSADIVLPNINSDINGRRRPILELGFGYRFREHVSAHTLPSMLGRGPE
jgi:hypothetical protein